MRTTTAATHKATPPADHHHCHRSIRVSRCGASKKGMTPMAPSSHVHSGPGFHPGIPVLQGHGNPQWCPQRGKRRPEGAATIATNGGGFRPENTIPAARSRPMTEAHTPPQPRHLNWEKPVTARGATTAPPASTCQPPTPPPRRRRTTNAVEEEKRNTTILPKHPMPTHRTSQPH